MAALLGRVRSQSFTFTVSGGSATGAAPTTDATDGVDLSDSNGYRITIAAASGQTLSGSGTAKCYYYNETLAAWGRNPGLDISLTESSVRFQDEDFDSPGPQIGRLKYVPDTVAVSGGANVTIVIELRTAT